MEDANKTYRVLYQREKSNLVKLLMLGGSIAAGHDLRLPAIKRQDRGPFNKSKEIERRRKQIERRRK